MMIPLALCLWQWMPFQVNDDIRLRHDRTVVGKFSDTTKTVVEYIPRQMVQSDVETLFWFFQLVTYKFIAQQYGGITQKLMLNKKFDFYY